MVRGGPDKFHVYLYFGLKAVVSADGGVGWILSALYSWESLGCESNK